MSKYIITGGYKLDGSVAVDCAKNAYLPILAGTIMCEEQVILRNCPKFVDVLNMCKILEKLNMKVVFQDDAVVINGENANPNFVPVEVAKLLRSSIFTLGAMLARFKRARVAYPGGCDIGLRPINLHLKGLRDMGVKITESHGVINCDASNLHGGKVVLDYPSVGATENLMMCAVLGKEHITILNGAREPEIADLANFLNLMGAKIYGAGTSTIEIDGVDRLYGVEYTPIGDRIIAGTYLIAGAITGGQIEVTNCNPHFFASLIDKLHNSGCVLRVKSDKIYLKSPKVLKSVGFVETQSYPGFPTDLQAQILALQTVSRGCCVIQENLFESRFKFVPELIKMGANVRAKERTAVVEGVPFLSGAEVYAKDLRGGASLVLAGLNAHGYTTVNDIHHIERGYCDLNVVLNNLGASIKKVI
ncbi:MAG: UDP-N-acetylglucosamine 1-carboxyvinyltransferase [Clostridia bacterium]|nr:UDP-N-acetylglucosamine 1-carboxyvinyltransferase [Clostridia bacterium]